MSFLGSWGPVLTFGGAGYFTVWEGSWNPQLTLLADYRVSSDRSGGVPWQVPGPCPQRYHMEAVACLDCPHCAGYVTVKAMLILTGAQMLSNSPSLRAIASGQVHFPLSVYEYVGVCGGSYVPGHLCLRHPHTYVSARLSLWNTDPHRAMNVSLLRAEKNKKVPGCCCFTAIWFTSGRF